MKSLLVFLVVTSNQCLVHCFLISHSNDTERIRRSSEANMQQIMFSSYNDYIESKSAEKCFTSALNKAISSAL